MTSEVSDSDNPNMGIVQKLSTTIVVALFIAFLTVITALPTLASNLDSGVQDFKVNFNVEEILLAQNLVSQNNVTGAEKERRQSTTIEEWVCRYINGQKRCWDNDK